MSSYMLIWALTNRSSTVLAKHLKFVFQIKCLTVWSLRKSLLVKQFFVEKSRKVLKLLKNIGKDIILGINCLEKWQNNEIMLVKQSQMFDRQCLIVWPRYYNMILSQFLLSPIIYWCNSNHHNIFLLQVAVEARDEILNHVESFLTIDFDYILENLQTEEDDKVGFESINRLHSDHFVAYVRFCGIYRQWSFDFMMIGDFFVALF